MASERRQFMSGLQKSAKHINKRKRKTQQNVRGESPLPRELTQDETLLLNEIMDSDEENVPKCKKKTKIFSAKSQNRQQILDVSSNNKLLYSKKRCQQTYVNSLEAKPTLPAKNLNVPSRLAGVTETNNANQNIVEQRSESQSMPKSSSPEKSSLPSSHSSLDNTITSSDQNSPKLCTKSQIEPQSSSIKEQEATFSSASLFDISLKKSKESSQVHTYIVHTSAQIEQISLENKDLSPSSGLIDALSNKEQKMPELHNKTECQSNQQLLSLEKIELPYVCPENLQSSSSKASQVSQENTDLPTSTCSMDIVTNKCQIPLVLHNQTHNAQLPPLLKNPDLPPTPHISNVPVVDKNQSDTSNNLEPGENEFESGNVDVNDTINREAVDDDTIYDGVLLNSNNPVLNAVSVPASPAALSTNKAVVEKSYLDSPNFSPYISQQIMHLGGSMPNSPAPRTPSEILALPSVESHQDCGLSSRSPSPKVIAEKKKRQTNTKKDKGRVRNVHKNQWKDVQRKANRNSGKEYQSRDGKIRNKRILGPPCKENCMYKCCSKFDTEKRKLLFSKFWKMGDLIRHWDYITKYCEKINKRSATTESISRRQYTIRYYLPDRDEVNGEEIKIRVCKTMFLNTFNIKEGLVNTAFKKLSVEDTAAKDERGCFLLGRKRVITEQMKASVCDHVNSFTPIEAHYVRSESTKLYLDGSLSVAKMFKFYLEWEDDMNREKVKTVRQYRDILNENFNIAFHIPKKDQCDVCVQRKHLENPVTEEEHKKYTTHIRNKTIAREMKNKDKETAKNNKQDTIAAVYDFQKVHGLPHGEASILYYKRKLSVFNFTVYDLGNSIGTCYVWDETTAKRGSVEVATCLYDFIEHHTLKGIKTFYFYSDNCGGQNRNRVVFAAYMRAAKDFNVTIYHKYLEKGHTQNEGDSVHALIEKSAKNKMVFIPDQRYAMIRWAKQDDKPYVVKEMCPNDFVDFKLLLPCCNWSKNTNNEIVYWSRIRQLQILPNESGQIYYKTDFCSHNYECIEVDKSEQVRTKRRGKNKEELRTPMHSRRLQPAYQNKLPIPKAKLKDLKYLCEHNIVPPKYHSFYESLVEGDTENIEEEEEE